MVNTTDDRDDELCNLAHCSLREAIDSANRTPNDGGPDTIGFAIREGPQTIAPAGALPEITQPVVIDGTTQPGYDGTPIIELDGTNAGPVDGLQVNTTGSTIKGLVVNRFVGPNKAGISLGPGGGGNTVAGNYIGTDMTGKVALGNTHGVSTLSPDNVIGGTTAAARNVISGNQGFGIQISSGQGGDRTVVEGNYVGTDATGGSDLGNASSGIATFTNLNRIGGPTDASGNVVSGNDGGGITVFWHLSDGNTIENNLVGTAADGATTLGNRDFGVSVAGSDNQVVRNTIANSASPGIRVYRNDAYAGATDPVGNLLSENSIGANSGLGIDLTLDSGVTANDPGDGDAGANDLQNFPVLESAETNGSDSIVVRATLNTNSENIARVEFFASAGCDSSGNGEGARYIGTSSVDTGGGTVEFSGGFEVPVAVGESITATASIGGNTSEFSNCVEATDVSGGPTPLVVTRAAGTNDGVCDEDCTLPDAIAVANTTAEADTITFDIGGSPPHRIAATSGLPEITETVVIDGTTQPGYEGTPVVAVDGQLETANLFVISAGESTIRGLEIVRAKNAGVALNSNGNVLEQNVIGADDLPNGTGVLVNGSANVIGGVGRTSAGNEIAFNTARGLVIATGTGNRISGNSIHTNGGLGVDLAPTGVTANDPGDGDAGANGLQNFPLLTGVTADGSALGVVGTLASTEASSYRIEFFSDSACDPSGNGEGRHFLGSTSIETNSDGQGSFEASLTLPEGDSVLTATATDGNGSTSEFSACRAVGDTGEGLTLTVNAGSNPAGSATQSVPLASIPSNQLNAFSGSPDSVPVGSIPVGSIPVGSIPVGSIPVGSIPVGSIPVGSIPVGSIPVGSIPVGSIGPNAIPVGSIGLDQILLTSLPVDWAPIFAGTSLEGRVLQVLTLADVYSDSVARGRFAQLLSPLTAKSGALVRALFGGVSYAALLLGDTKLSDIPPPEAPDWCAAITAAGGSCNGVDLNTNTVAGLTIAGIPVGSIPVGSIPVGSIAGGIAGTPVGSIPVGSIDLNATPLGAILLKDIPNVNTVVDCARISCTTDRTLGHAAALTPTAIRPTATLAALQTVLGNTTLNELIIGIIPRSALPWELFPIDGLQLFNTKPVKLRYTVEFDLACANKAGLAVTVKLPDGDIAVPQSTTLSYGNAAEVAGPNPTTDPDTGARWTGLPDPCPGALTSQHIRLSFDALSGFDLGAGTASARVDAGGQVQSVGNQAPVLVTQNWETNDDVTPTAPLVQPDQLVIGHVARAGDQEVFRVPIPTALGTVTTFYLSHIAADADLDLVIGVPGVPALQSSPVGSIPVGSIPIEDKGSDFDNSGQALPPETLQDIPVGSIPVGSISANRGNADEVAQVVARGETGFYTIVVRGYNGSFTREPFVLRVKQTPAPPLPACSPRGLTLPAHGTLPPGVAADTKTLFLVNKQRIQALSNATDTNAMLASLNTLAARPEVKGAVLQVDGNAAVRTAYAQWDANPCNVEAANTVARRINDVVTPYRQTLTDLRYVVLLGSDDALPMARVPDRVSISPESDFAAELQFTTANLTKGNAIYSAAALSYFLTDGGYGAFTKIPWLGRELLLPQVSVSRLVESSADIKGQLDQYIASGGVLDPQTALTTGYDFLTDGADATGTALAALVAPGGTATSLISDTWTRADLLPAFTGKTPPDDVNAVNAHYNQWQLEPAAATNAQDLVATTDVTVSSAFLDRILFTVGCHGGFNVPNTLLTSVVPQARDWAETWARQRAAVYVANTGFGYGDTQSNALSERLMSIFAAKLNQAKPIGELWNDAQHEYYASAGAYDVYDEKALTEASLFGLPFWTIDGAAPPPSPTPPPVITDPVTGLPVAQLAVDLTTAPRTLTEHTPPRGSYWDFDVDFDGRRPPQVTHFRPLQPRLEQDVTRPGEIARGIIITSLETDDETDVDPVLAQPTIDLSGHEPERNFRDVVFPANLVNLTRSRGLRGDRQSFVLNAGQFRPDTPAGPTGIERLVRKIGVEVAYAPSGNLDFTPPSVRQVGSNFTGSQATIFVDVTDPTTKRVAALYNNASEWKFAELTNLTGTTLWTATVTTNHVIEVAAMAQDPAGNVGYSVNKGFNFLSLLTGGTRPDILIDAPLPGAVYTLRQAVPARFFCSAAAGLQSCDGTVGNGETIDTSTVGPHTFMVTAVDLAGGRTTRSVTYFVRYAFDGFLDPNNIRFKDPPKLNSATAHDLVQLFFKLRDAAGGVISDPRVATSIYSRQVGCNERPPTEADVPPVPPTEDFFFVSSKQSFKYMWHTEAAWTRTCRRLVFVLDDGSKHFLDFKFR